MAARASVGAPKSLCFATGTWGNSGSLITNVKLLPSGQVFCVPLHSLTRSASGTSASLLPIDVTTAMFLIAGIAGAARHKQRARAAASRTLSLNALMETTLTFDED